MHRSFHFVTLALLVMAGCTAGLERGDRGRVRDTSVGMAGAEPHRNPVIVVPGLTGSRLVDGSSGRSVWGELGGDYVRPDRPEDLRLYALPMREGAPLSELRDEVVPDGVLDRMKLRLLGISVNLRAYSEIVHVLVNGGYRDETLYSGDDYFNCFEFDYDWRRDNVEGARRLGDFIAEKQRYVRDEIERRTGRPAAEVKFDVVAHSMGALLVRYYLRYGTAALADEGPLPEVTWAGARHIERAILVGPPNEGTLESVEQLVHGRNYGPSLPTYPAALLGTFPSGYQMLPRERYGMVRVDGKPVDPLDPEVWRRLGWGLAAPEADAVLEALLPDVPDPSTRRRIALEHQGKALRRARRFSAALDRSASPPRGLTLALIAGDSIPTPRMVSVDSSTGRLGKVRLAPGDGKVLRSSALMDGRLTRGRPAGPRRSVEWEHALLLSGTHMGLIRNPAFSDNLLSWLLEQPR